MTQNLVKNIISNVSSSYQVNLVIKNPNITYNYIICTFYLPTLGSCNAYLNIRHVVGMFLIGQILFYLGGLGANRNVSGKLSMKLAINIQNQTQLIFLSP